MRYYNELQICKEKCSPRVGTDALGYGPRIFITTLLTEEEKKANPDY